MMFQMLILTGILLLFVNFILNMLFLKRPSKNAALPAQPPLVSVLIPARNEEEGIARCLYSILNQDYPNIEVLALDDNSTDSTYDIMRTVANSDPRVHLMKGKPLPEGWAGKCFACHQMSQDAKGEWLLFVDADTVLEPWAVRSTVDIAGKEDISLLSGFPQQKVSGNTQKLVIPILFYFIIMSWFPLWWLHLLNRPRPTMAIGQFLLFNGREYRRVGGHELVKSRIMEDAWFGIEMGRKGGRSLSVDLSRAVTTYAYTNIAEMSEGCMKWFYSVAALSPILLIFFIMAAHIFYLAPFYWILAGSANDIVFNGMLLGWQLIVGTQIILILLMRFISDIYFKGPPFSFLFHPAGMVFLILAAIYSFLRRVAGAGVAWKERVYEAISQIK